MAKTAQAIAGDTLKGVLPAIIQGALWIVIGYIAYTIVVSFVAKQKSQQAYRKALEDPDSPENYAKTLYQTGIAKPWYSGRWVDGDYLNGIAKGIKSSMLPAIIDAYNALYSRSLIDDIDSVTGYDMAEFESNLKVG